MQWKPQRNTDLERGKLASRNPTANEFAARVFRTQPNFRKARFA